jgi:hypothetical protein
MAGEVAVLSIAPVLAATAAATIFSAAALAAPAVLAVRRLLRHRFATPLQRGSLERNLVFASTLIGAAGAVICTRLASVLPPASYDAGVSQGLALCFLAPLPLAVVPWLTGELLSGGSRRAFSALFGAAAVSCVAGWGALLLTGLHQLDRYPAELALVQLAIAAVESLAAAHVYVALRGEPRLKLLTPAR